MLLLIYPAFVDEIIWREALICLGEAAKIVGCDQVIEVVLWLIKAVVSVASGRGFLDGSIQSLNLPSGS